MSEPVSRAEMDRYMQRDLSPDELKAFNAKLKEFGLASSIDGAPSGDLLNSIRPGARMELFDEEELLLYVQGKASPSQISAIETARKGDSDLDEILTIMEGAKRQVDASLAMVTPEAKPRNSKRLFLWGLTAGLAAGLVMIAVKLQRPTDPAMFAINVSASHLTPEEVAKAASYKITHSAEVQSALSSLDTAHTDNTKLTPSRSLVLPSQTTQLTWDGIKAPTVRCSLRDASGAVLAQADVTTGKGWTYKKTLPKGDYDWSAEWDNVKGEHKKATRHFRVVDGETARVIQEKLDKASGPVDQAELLADAGFTYQSLQVIEAAVAKKPESKELQQLHDTISSEATLG